MLALEEAFLSTCRISRAIIFHFNSKTQWQMFLLLYGRHILCPSEGHKHGVSIQSSINLGDTLLQIKREWKTAKTWFLARLFIYQSSIVSPILDLIHWMVTVFSFHHMTSENREYYFPAFDHSGVLLLQKPNWGQFFMRLFSYWR